MIVVSDTSVIFYLSQIGEEEILPRLFTTVIVPEAVWNELDAVVHLPFVAKTLEASWLKRERAVDRQTVNELLQEVDAGEAEAIALSVQLAAQYLLIDERRGRRAAAKRAIRIVGTLGVFVLAKQTGLIPAVKPLIERLLNETGFRYSQKIIDQVIKDAGEN